MVDPEKESVVTLETDNDEIYQRINAGFKTAHRSKIFKLPSCKINII